MKLCGIAFQCILQVVFLQSVCFPHQSFNAVPVHGFFKIPAACTKAGFQFKCALLLYAKNPEREIGKAVTFRKQRIDRFAAFKPVVFL